jgi:chromosome segregation ATPase
LLFAKVWPRRFAPPPPLSTPDFARRQELDRAQRDLQKEIDALRDKIDARFLGLAEKIEQLKSDLLAAGERRSDSLHQRINRLESGLARVDERTKFS